MNKYILLSCIALFFTISCSQPDQNVVLEEACDKNMAMNKYLALKQSETNVVAKLGEKALVVSKRIGEDAELVLELIKEGLYQEACIKTKKLERKHYLNLQEIEGNMITYEEAEKFTKNEQTECNKRNASIKHTKLKEDLNKEVNSGRMDNAVFQLFEEDTKDYADLLKNNPNGACELISNLRIKYGLV